MIVFMLLAVTTETAGTAVVMMDMQMTQGVDGALEVMLQLLVIKTTVLQCVVAKPYPLQILEWLLLGV